ncbi:MAG: DUF2256 domain-containing protein [Alphaproteobacteria bacterium]|nr:DUF2256 domain-containing protein [Alphaproteobacteria bacterium]
MAPAREKSALPVKTCLHCGRLFTWRKKWARCWDAVRYCSKRCGRERRRGNKDFPRDRPADA